jgi:hypothetical protein
MRSRRCRRSSPPTVLLGGQRLEAVLGDLLGAVVDACARSFLGMGWAGAGSPGLAAHSARQGVARVDGRDPVVGGQVAADGLADGSRRRGSICRAPDVSTPG